MTKAEAVRLFGTMTKLAESLGITIQAVSQWPDGEIQEPRHSQVLRAAYDRGLIKFIPTLVVGRRH